MATPETDRVPPVKVDKRNTDRRWSRIWAAWMSYWKPISHPHLEEFLQEQFRATRAAIRGAMIVGACVFLIRGFMDWKSGVIAPNIHHEIALRSICSTILFGLVLAFNRSTPSHQGEKMMSSFVFVLVAGLVGAVVLNDIRAAYSLFPIVFVCLMSSALWMRGKHLVWTLATTLAPVAWLIGSGYLPPLDEHAYIFYIPTSIFLGILLRQGRLKTAFDAFLLRKHLAAQALNDPLTGILNRAGWNDHITAQLVGGAPRRPSTVLYFDLDKFKNINDTYGHPVGDKLIQSTAERVKAMLRPNDIMARFGGEEFVVFLPGVRVADATAIAERIREEIASHPDPVPATVSIGVSEFRAGETIDQAVDRADQALLQSKQNGRNRVTVAP